MVGAAITSGGDAAGGPRTGASLSWTEPAAGSESST
jgi:hypothetical protein